MRIVISDFLPYSNICRELPKLLQNYAPYLHNWLQIATVQLIEDFNPIEAGCTIFEAWKLKESGFIPKPGQLLGSGLGPLIANAKDHNPVWLAELVHLILENDQVKLFDPNLMDIKLEETKELLISVHSLVNSIGFMAEILNERRWRLFLPKGLSPICTSPALMINKYLNKFWNCDPTLHLWRVLFNHIQMIWYEHPINKRRIERGVPPINGLWLYGGAEPWPYLENNSSTYVFTKLNQSYQNSDWITWLETLAKFDNCYIKKLCDQNGSPNQAIELLLLGYDRKVKLILKPKNNWFICNLFTFRKKNWSLWWFHQN